MTCDTVEVVGVSIVNKAVVYEVQDVSASNMERIERFRTDDETPRTFEITYATRDQLILLRATLRSMLNRQHKTASTWGEAITAPLGMVITLDKWGRF